jgi:hypothetical protein
MNRHSFASSIAEIATSAAQPELSLRRPLRVVIE